jgi:release factor H-coupled RctB family protein
MALVPIAGRKFERASMKARIGKPKGLSRTRYGGREVCEDKQMLIEEAPKAYKNIQAVLGDIEAYGLAESALTLHPFVTFKKAVQR